MHGVSQDFTHVVGIGDNVVRVILHVAQIGAQRFGNNILMQTNQLIADFVHRHRGVAQRQQLTPQRIDMLHRFAVKLGAEHRALHFADAFAKRGGDIAVVINDKIENAVEWETDALAQHFRALGGALAQRRIAVRRAVAHGNQEFLADEEVRFAKFDMVFFGQVRRFQYDKQRFAILLQLRTLVGGQCILDRQFMQAELLLHFLHKRRIGLIKSQPDKSIRLVYHVADVLRVDNFPTLSVAVNDTVHNHSSTAPLLNGFIPG